MPPLLSFFLDKMIFLCYNAFYSLKALFFTLIYTLTDTLIFTLNKKMQNGTHGAENKKMAYISRINEIL